jgi:hypothetical protein
MSDYFAPMAPDPMSGVMRLQGGDGRLWVRFEKRSRRNAYKSEQEGRPIYEPIDYVRIQQPGERDQWVGPVTPDHKARFPRQWEQYLKETEQSPEGTPIQLLFPNEPHIIELLLDLKIETVEQLSQVTEQGIDRLGMDGRKYVGKAQAAMDKSEALKEVTKLSHELQDAQDQLGILKEANAGLHARMQALEGLITQAGQQPTIASLAPPERAPPPAAKPKPPRPEIVG